MLRILIRNIVSNSFGYGVHAVVAFFLTPFVINSLGDARYGIWALVTGLTGYYGLLDLGFRGGISQYFTRHLAQGDIKQLNRTASTAFVAMVLCGSLVAALSLVLAWLAPALFTIPADALWETRWCIVVIGCSVAVQFACFPYSAVFTATQRYDLANMIGVGTRLATALATVIALKLGCGLIALSVIGAVGEFLAYVLRWRVVLRILPALHISPRLANAESFWPLTSYGIWIALINGANQLVSYSEVVVISLFVPVAGITPFVVSARVAEYFDQFFRPMTIVLFPVATSLDARGNSQTLRSLYLAGTRYLFLVSIPAAIIGAVWANDFFCLWVGPRLVEGREYTSVTVLFYVLLATAVPSISQKIGFQILAGTRRVKQLGIIVGCEAFANVALSICLIRPFGLLGAALGTLIPSLINNLILYPWCICRFLNISRGTYLAKVFPRPLIVGILFAPLMVLARYTTEPAGSWGALAVRGLLASAVASLVLIAVGLDAEERRNFAVEPLRRMLRYLLGRRVAAVPAVAQDTARLEERA